MNKIRYRVWDGRKMWYPTKKVDYTWRIERTGMVWRCTAFYDETVHSKAPSVYAMLSTGRYDKNDKEMFAEDIMNLGDNYPSVVRFGDSEWNEGVGFYLEEVGPDRYYRCHTLDAYTTTPVVLGNIYENGELVEEVRDGQGDFYVWLWQSYPG